MPGFAAMEIGTEKSVEALGKIWGERPFNRRTRGHAGRTKAVAMLLVMANELGFEDCRKLATGLADSWAAEDGWDTIQLIKALAATKAQPMFQEATE